MSAKRGNKDPGARGGVASHLGSAPPDATGGGRRRHPWRVALLSLIALFVAALSVGAAAYGLLNHMASSIRRVNVSHLVATDGPRAGETFLITGSPFGPTGTSVPAPSASGLIALLHINANRRAGGVVSLQPQAIVRVPGYGRDELEDALKIGGPSLLVETVEDLTHVPINHYARINFYHAADLVNAIGGVDVQVPVTTTSFGHTFVAGTNHLDGLTALYYVRQPSLTEQGRILRQQNLLRAMVQKIGNDHLLLHPVTMYRLLSALTRALTVDSNFTNAEIVSVARQLSGLSGSAATFVTAPTVTFHGEVRLNPRISHQLWQAIRHDSLAAFAKKYPETVTPTSVP